MLPLVFTVVLLLVSTLLFCNGKKTSRAVVISITEVDPPIAVTNKEKTPVAVELPKEPEKTDEKMMDCTLDKLSAIGTLLNQEAAMDEEHIEAVLRLAIKTESYIWTMKKRLAADESSWKELSKKIEKLKAEGFCVKAGSEEAKRLRKQGEGGQNLLAATMVKNKAASRFVKKDNRVFFLAFLPSKSSENHYTPSFFNHGSYGGNYPGIGYGAPAHYGTPQYGGHYGAPSYSHYAPSYVYGHNGFFGNYGQPNHYFDGYGLPFNYGGYYGGKPMG